jgi:hypothetical protein
MELLDAATPEDEAARLWRSYWVFTATRNPWARAVSQYKFLARKLLPKPGCDELVSCPLCGGRMGRARGAVSFYSNSC